MPENTIKIIMPELTEAINRLTQAVETANRNPASVMPEPEKEKTAFPISQGWATPPTVAQTSPVPQVAQNPPTGVPVAQAMTPAATVPITAPRAYSRDELARAGAALVDAGKQPELVALLSKYGVQSINALDASQYGAFATDLRGLGANI